MEACRGGDLLVPSFLLDRGADPNIGGLVYIDALVSVVEVSQPSELIKKMFECLVIVRPITVRTAIRCQWVDVLKSSRRIFEGGHETKDKEFIATVEKRLKVGKERTRKEKGNTTGVGRSWWQLWRESERCTIP